MNISFIPYCHIQSFAITTPLSASISSKFSDFTYKVNHVIFIFVLVKFHLTVSSRLIHFVTNESIFLFSKIMYPFLISFNLFCYPWTLNLTLLSMTNATMQISLTQWLDYFWFTCLTEVLQHHMLLFLSWRNFHAIFNNAIRIYSPSKECNVSFSLHNPINSLSFICFAFLETYTTL